MKTKLFSILFLAMIMAILPLSAARYYLYTGVTNPWGTKGDGTVTQVTDLTTTLNGLAANDSAWLAAGTYSTSGQITTKSGQIIRGGFSGSETNVASRTLSDADGNGVVEPWEFSNATIINGSLSSVNYPLFISEVSNTMTLNGLTIDGHSTSNANGGALYFNNNSTIQNCIIRNITHTGTGGAAIWSNSFGGVSVLGCLIENCNTTGIGGAIYANRKITLKQSVLRNNYAGNLGGALYFSSTTDASNTSNIINNAIYNNTAGSQGGAISIADNDAPGPLNFVNNTIVNNVACLTTGGSTGGIIGMRATNQKFYNNVIYNNYHNGTSVVSNVRTTLTSSNIDFQYSAYNGGATLGAGSTFTATGNVTNLTTPNFVQPSSSIGYTATMPVDVQHANFSIQYTSTLKNVGVLPATLPEVPSVDLMGNKRPDGSFADMGAYEFASKKYYLYTGATNPWGTKSDGIVTQVTDLTATLNALAVGDSVWMAAGTYSTTGQITFKLGQIIRGGFSGTETNIASRTLNDADGNGVVEPWEFSNATVINGSVASVSYSLFSSELGNAMTVNGVTVDGHNTSNANGGAFYFNNNATIQNCIVRNIIHTGTGGGGAIWSNTYGGVNVVGCLIENCTTASNGGAIYAYYKANVKQSVIRNNYASVKAGALFLNSGTDASNTSNILNNSIYNNSAGNQGGAVVLADYDGTGPLNFVNNTIVNNVALGGSTGGILGMRAGVAGSPSSLQKFYNNVIFNNFQNGTTTLGNLRSVPASVTIDLQYSAYNGGTTLGSGSSFVATGNINNLSTPNFVQSSTTKGYTATMPNDVKMANFAILSNSPLKDAGALTSTISVVPTIDLLGNARPDASLNDIGAYEYFYNPATTLSSEKSEFNASQISVSPNPVKDYLKVAVSGKEGKVSIINLLGQELSTQIFTENTQVLFDVQSLKPGCYGVLVVQNGKVSNSKFIKL